MTQALESTSADLVAKDTEDDSGKFILARVGSFALLVDGSKKHADILKELVAALQSDPRVTTVQWRDEEAQYSNFLRVYPSRHDGNDDRVVAGLDFRSAVELTYPIRIQLHVPTKNQPRFLSEEDPPAEDYFVAWDGYSLVVAWNQDEPDERRAGGHVVLDVLQEAASIVDGEIYVEGCHPGCSHLFLHQTIELRDDPSVEGIDFSRGRLGHAEVVAKGEDLADADEGALALFRWCCSAETEFAQMKNNGRRILDIERVVRSDLDQLMAVHYQRARLSTAGFTAWITGLRSMWSWRKTTKVLLARLWIAVAKMERLRRIWASERGYFERFVEERGTNLLFEGDHLDDAKAVESLDLVLIEGSLQEVGGRLDNSAIVLATAASGAIGLIGVVIGSLLT